MAQWYYTSNGQQLGPVDDATLKQLVSSGHVAASDLVWKDGMAGWVAASTIPELGGMTGAASYPAGSYPQASGSQPIPYGGYATPQQQQHPQGSVPNYLVQSILVTILCCWPLGIPAIVFAAQVNGKLATGDYAGAVESSNKAKMFSWISFGLGLLWGVVVFLVIISGALSHR